MGTMQNVDYAGPTPVTCTAESIANLVKKIGKNQRIVHFGRALAVVKLAMDLLKLHSEWYPLLKLKKDRKYKERL